MARNWCNAHQREATATAPDGRPRCDPSLGGLACPCDVVDLEGIAEIVDRRFYEYVDIGYDHRMKLFSWRPDRALNPQYADVPDVEFAGVLVEHRSPYTGEPCKAALYFETMRGLSTSALWTVESLDPLTISPSVGCGLCGDHGFIQGGRWVPSSPLEPRDLRPLP